MKKLVLAGYVACLFTACSPTATLTPGAEVVKVMKGDPSPTCKEITSIDATLGGWPGTRSLEPYKNDLRNKAYENGANYVRLDTVLYSEGGTIMSVAGTAFMCP